MSYRAGSHRLHRRSVLGPPWSVLTSRHLEKSEKRISSRNPEESPGAGCLAAPSSARRPGALGLARAHPLSTADAGRWLSRPGSRRGPEAQGLVNQSGKHGREDGRCRRGAALPACSGGAVPLTGSTTLTRLLTVGWPGRSSIYKRKTGSQSCPKAPQLPAELGFGLYSVTRYIQRTVTALPQQPVLMRKHGGELPIIPEISSKYLLCAWHGAQTRSTRMRLTKAGHPLWSGSSATGALRTV